MEEHIMEQQKMTKQIFGTSKEIFMKKYGIIFVLILMVTFLSIVSPTFRTMNNWISILQQISVNGVLALGMVFVITAGGIDLSIGSMLALTSVIIGSVLNGGGSIAAATSFSITMCALCGILNGFLTAKLNMFPFVVTLSTQFVIRGIAYIVAKGKSVTLVDAYFRQIGMGRLNGIIPYSILILLFVALISYTLLHWTRFGRYIYAVGGNIYAATASGVNVIWTRIFSFLIMGVCSGIAGVILTSRINAAQPNIGIGYETDAIAACVIGGTSFSGGVATIPGTVIGIIIIGVIYNGMNLLKVDSYYQTVVKGALIIVAVLLDMFINKRRS
jgi:ribose/xylose/arabinose/galactoside ABC-type transport system permease subunit